MVYAVDKNQLRVNVRNRIICTKPELLHKFTNKKFAEAMLVLKGFLACLKIMAEDPVRKEDIDELIITELTNYVLDIEES